MSDLRRVKRALISVYHKDFLDTVLAALGNFSVGVISTGGTAKYIREAGYTVETVEEITGYPSILGGRVKTLHPCIFGGILARKDVQEDHDQLVKYNIPAIDLVIVDLYPFEETVRSGAVEKDVIEQIDIGGISLIRAAAKNYKDVLVVSGRHQYDELISLLQGKEGATELSDRKRFAAEAFDLTSAYDAAIFNHYNDDSQRVYKISMGNGYKLRYGENPHQSGIFYGGFREIFDKLHGKAVSYNNLLDIDAAVGLISDFRETTFAVLKHNNACGVASRESLVQAWKDALAGDPVSAFGGVLITNRMLDEETAGEIHKLFFEVIIAPGYEQKAMEILRQKKNRIILKQKKPVSVEKTVRSCLHGMLVQDKDRVTENAGDLQVVTTRKPGEKEMEDMLFGNKIVKHTKSNAIVLAKNKQLIASGVGQTSRVDALKQAVAKAESFHFDLDGAVMASDAFFPFADSVEIAHLAGISSVIQPGGSIRDKDSIEYCNSKNMAMVFTGIRHFKH